MMLFKSNNKTATKVKQENSSKGLLVYKQTYIVTWHIKAILVNHLMIIIPH